MRTPQSLAARSLELHRRVAEKIRQHPELFNKAFENISRWRATTSAATMPYLDEWQHILEQKTATPEGFPFRSPYVKRLPAYSPDMCPRTRDIMTRVGMIGIAPSDTPEWASAFAKDLNEKLATEFGL